MTAEKNRISESTLQRLPLYHRCLKRFGAMGREFVSCPHIASELKLDPTQVRKDISVTGVLGKTRVGFHIPDTLAAIESFLGWDNVSEAFLVGAGYLGSALLRYRGFEDNGMAIVAAFDDDPAKIGTKVAGHEVLPLEKIDSLVGRMNIRIAVLTVPAASAQQLAMRLVNAGILAIWNFTPVWLDLPDRIVVENVNLASSLAVLSQRLRELKDKENM